MLEVVCFIVTAPTVRGGNRHRAYKEIKKGDTHSHPETKTVFYTYHTKQTKKS